MRSKVADRILSKTPEETKTFARLYGDSIIEKRMKTKKEIKKLKKTLKENLKVVKLHKKSADSSDKAFIKGLSKEIDFLEVEINILNWVLKKNK